MGEFDLIDEIVRALGSAAASPQVICGPGDDASVVRPPPGYDAVASIDSLLPDVHFPACARPQDIGYRALAVSLSDLSAMAAKPGYVLVALTLPDADVTFARQLATGMAEAAEAYGVPIVGGNLARGPLSISVSVHGWSAPGAALLRSGASAGETLFVTGALGATAAALAAGIASEDDAGLTSRLRSRYFRPANRGPKLRQLARQGLVTSAIDISDGLLSDATHLARSSDVGLWIDSALIPVFPESTLAHVLAGSDDYEVLLTSAETTLEDCTAIGRVMAFDSDDDCRTRVRVDGEPAIGGYDHFGANP